MQEQVAKLVGTVQPKGSVVGSLQRIVGLQGSVVAKATIVASVLAPTLIDLPVYKGPYEVYPEVTKQEFETMDKRMVSDLAVMEIPYHEVSNVSGTTVIIGGIENG